MTFWFICKGSVLPLIIPLGNLDWLKQDNEINEIFSKQMSTSLNTFRVKTKYTKGETLRADKEFHHYSIPLGLQVTAHFQITYSS